jgi:hypothetical protein
MAGGGGMVEGAGTRAVRAAEDRGVVAARLRGRGRAGGGRKRPGGAAPIFFAIWKEASFETTLLQDLVELVPTRYARLPIRLSSETTTGVPRGLCPFAGQRSARGRRVSIGGQARPRTGSDMSIAPLSHWRMAPSANPHVAEVVVAASVSPVRTSPARVSHGRGSGV